MTARRRILFVSPSFSTAPKSASEVRALHVARALNEIADVEVIVVAPKEETAPAQVMTEFHVAEIIAAHRRPNVGWRKKAAWLVNPRLSQPHGVAVDGRSSRLLRNAVREFDLTWFFKLRTANMFPVWEWQRSVVDVDDVPSLFEHSLLSKANSAQIRLASMLRVWSWRRRERLLGERFNVVAVCSEADKQYLSRLGVAAPMHVIGNGFDRPSTTPVRRPVSPPRIGFIGVFDHAPNAEGVRWFVRHCWPLVKEQVPDARLRLVGRLTDGSMKPDGPDIDALGYQSDANGEMSTWAAMVVPVHAGAGTRGKIAHAFSQKCPVVSTRLGAYGYDPIDGRDMLLADSAPEFAQACVRAILEPELGGDLADRAWDRFLEHWTWDSIRPAVWAAAEQCLRTSTRQA